MAVGESKQQVKSGSKITQVSWTDGTAQDVYYGLDHSFQYSANINADDEMHGLKLSTRPGFTSNYSKCQLVSLGDNGVMALPINVTSGSTIHLSRFEYKGYYATTPWDVKDSDAGSVVHSDFDATPGVVFQDYFWFGSEMGGDSGKTMMQVPLAVNAPGHGVDRQIGHLPHDHNDYTDESIEDPADAANTPTMQGRITAILNYNNSRLVVACGSDIWVYYPELDVTNPLCPLYPIYYPDPVQNPPAATDYGKTGWKKTLTFEAGVTIVALTCTFEYLKVRAVDEGWNTKVYYYQGNNNLRSTFVYNVVDLTGVRVLHVYSINGIDYYTSSIGLNASDALVDLHKMVGATPVKLFSQRAGLTSLDINTKAPYFVGPTSISGAYNDGNIYIADAYGVFKFRYNPNGFDKGYMKRKLNNVPTQVYGLCENKGFLYVSTEDGCYAMRLYDTGVDGYQSDGVLISREFEGKEGGTITKMLDEIRLNYEMNPMTEYNGSIDIYVSPNNLWRTTQLLDGGEVVSESDLPSATDCEPGTYYYAKAENTYYMVVVVENSGTYTNAWTDIGDTIPWLGNTVAGWFKVMHLDQTNGKTRAEKSNLFNDLHSGESAFKFDWQTITYAIVIRRGEEEKATPIVRQIDIKYHCKDKVNNVYDIN